MHKLLLGFRDLLRLLKFKDPVDAWTGILFLWIGWKMTGNQELSEIHFS